MILGGGMMARAFACYEHDSDVLIFASGVANSGEKNRASFERETATLAGAIRDHSDKLLVYFGTCSVDDADVAGSDYVLHKLRMEDLVRSARAGHLLLRLPQVVGRSANRATLVNHLYDRIMKDEPFSVWANAVRYLIDVDDVARIASHLIENGLFVNSTVNIVSRPYRVLEIVAAIEAVSGKRARYTLVDRGHPFHVDRSSIDPIARSLGVCFDDRYLEAVLRKYYA